VVGQERLQVRQPVLDGDQPARLEHAAELVRPLLLRHRAGRPQSSFRDGPAEPIGLAEHEVRDGQGFQEAAVQGEYRIEGNVPAAARIGQRSQHIRHRLHEHRRRVSQQLRQLGLDLLPQPRRLAGAREFGTSWQVIAPGRVGRRALVHR
jgi:hypothetical protein